MLSVKNTEIISLEDKYLKHGRVFLTGTQALVRLLLLQHQLDKKNNLNTACFVSGYRGSPLGGFDLELQRVESMLDESAVVFQPGINEELAATAVWGSQQAGMRDQSDYDGVYGIWYGKGPGVDRTGDAFRHANLAGTSKNGGVLALLGDDHTCESSTTCHQSEFAMVDAMIPTLNPAGVQEIIEFGLHGLAMSRYSGCWVGIKCVHDTVSSTVSTEISLENYNFTTPESFQMPETGVNIRVTDTPREQESRLVNYKLKAAQAYCRENKLDKIVIDSTVARIGVVTTGKSYLDVRQALADLGVDGARAGALGLRVYKVGLVWPLEETMAKEVCQGLDKVLVVEEKRDLIESQLKIVFYGAAAAPQIIGKTDEQGNELFRSTLDLNSNIVAIRIAEMILEVCDDAEISKRLRELRLLEARQEQNSPLKRTAYFCAGCPHSTSTHLPEGSRGMAGIGCAWMSQFMERNVDGYSQMGGEGASWIGEAPFSKTEHIFQNLGDGTYFHSGSMAIRSTVASGINITYKILFNDAVAMTGGQVHDGVLTPWDISWQVHSEGVNAIALVTDEPKKYPSSVSWAPGVTIHHRSELGLVQTNFRNISGTTVIIYDQTCAAEKRRKRKRKLYSDPAKRLFINSQVCEGCGDCGIASNCTALLPKESSLGRKREIDQSSCNKDYSCVNGFCPSFVTVLGGSSKKVNARKVSAGIPKEPELHSLSDGYSIVITGVGGTGVVTIGALLGMAAHISGKGVAVLDMTGMAQKGGAVMSHLRLSDSPDGIGTIRVASGGANLILGCDSVVTASPESLDSIKHGATRVIVNTQQVMPGDFTHDADLQFPADEITELIYKAAGAEQVDQIASSEYAQKYLGNSIGGNLLMLGFAFQRGLIPLSSASINQAIEVNGTLIEMNKRAFLLGRQIAVNSLTLSENQEDSTTPPFDSGDVAVITDHRSRLLVAYQNESYAQRYAELVKRVQVKEIELGIDKQQLSLAVAKYYFKLLAYKDEYEVARLYASDEFTNSLNSTFSGKYKLRFNLAPPLISRRDKETGHLVKREFGAWILTVFKLLRYFKGLRGTIFDIFGYTAERRMERRLVSEYQETIDEILQKLSSANYETAVLIAELPEKVRGFGHVKEQLLAQVMQDKEIYHAQFHNAVKAIPVKVQSVSR